MLFSIVCFGQNSLVDSYIKIIPYTSIQRTVANTFSSFDKMLELRMRIYPNPTSDIINIQFNKESVNDMRNLSVLIFNFLGERQSFKINKISNRQIQLDISNQEKGTYFIKVLVDNEVLFIEKFLVDK